MINEPLYDSCRVYNSSVNDDDEFDIKNGRMLLVILKSTYIYMI